MRNNKLLLILVVVLAGVFGVTKFIDFGGEESTFRDVLVEMDRDEVTQINIQSVDLSGGVQLMKENEDWKIEATDRNMIAVKTEMMEQIFSSLESITPKRVAARQESKYGELKVDDATGTRVVVKEGNETTLDMYIGKFEMLQPTGGQTQFHQQQPKFTTYVRLAKDKEVYIVDGLLDPVFKRQLSAYIDSTSLGIIPAESSIELMDSLP